MHAGVTSMYCRDQDDILAMVKTQHTPPLPLTHACNASNRK